MAERAGDRLVRLLGMVAYLGRHEGVQVDELAKQFGVSRSQVVQDVDTLWVTGTPGYWPDDLIDFDVSSMDRGVVRLIESRNMSRPLRLGAREGLVLVAALRALQAALEGTLDDERAQVVASALAKLSAATGELTGAVDVELAVSAPPQVAAALAQGLERHRRMHLRYVDASDVVTERDVDPIRLVAENDRGYLLAWCHASDDERLFRVDRIVAAQVLDVPAALHPVSAGADRFAPGPEGELVTLHLASTGRWVAEDGPVEAVRNLPDGSFEVDLRVVAPAWIRHLLTQVARDVLDVRPRSLAADVSGAAQAALAAYGPLADEGRG